MNKSLKCIMLIDDNESDNFFHNREIKKFNTEQHVITMNTGLAALKYLKSGELPHPDLIFLDINMPGMNGWEFLQQYNKLDKELQSSLIIIMLTTSSNPEDKVRATGWSFISEFRTKPLTKDLMEGISEKYFM